MRRKKCWKYDPKLSYIIWKLISGRPYLGKNLSQNRFAFQVPIFHTFCFYEGTHNIQNMSLDESQIQIPNEYVSSNHTGSSSPIAWFAQTGSSLVHIPCLAPMWACYNSPAFTTGFLWGKSYIRKISFITWCKGNG